METNNPISNLKDIFPRLEQTKNTYTLPFPDDINLKRVDRGGPSHKGPYKGAQDFIVDSGTSVVAPLDGKVVEVVDDNDKFGPSKEFENYLNYITLQHPNGEYSQLAHLEKGSSLVKAGDVVQTGQEIGVTGNSGWMTEPHLHLFIFKIDSSSSGFKGLKIKFK